MFGYGLHMSVSITVVIAATPAAVSGMPSGSLTELVTKFTCVQAPRLCCNVTQFACSPAKSQKPPPSCRRPNYEMPPTIVQLSWSRVLLHCAVPSRRASVRGPLISGSISRQCGLAGRQRIALRLPAGCGWRGGRLCPTAQPPATAHRAPRAAPTPPPRLQA